MWRRGSNLVARAGPAAGSGQPLYLRTSVRQLNRFRSRDPSRPNNSLMEVPHAVNVNGDEAVRDLPDLLPNAHGELPIVGACHRLRVPGSAV